MAGNFLKTEYSWNELKGNGNATVEFLLIAFKLCDFRYILSKN